jgi:magnesium transporter
VAESAEQTKELVDRILNALADGSDPSAVDPLLLELRPADLAEIIDRLDGEARVEFFRRVPLELRAETLSEVDEESWPYLLDGVEGAERSALFRELQADDAADILGELPARDAREILAAIEPEESREIAALMRYDDETAGGVMTTELVSVPATLTADEAIAAVRSQSQQVRDFFTVYAVDGEGRLVGTLPLRDLIVSAGTTPVERIMQTDVVRVLPTVDQEEVARLIARYNLISIPVVDEFDRLLGRITVDDVIDILEAEATEDFLRLSGVDEEEETYATPIEIVRSRIPWLLITLFTSGLGALVVAYFENTIARMTFIAVFMPVVAAMAGNSAVQATAVAVRRLALSRTPFRPLRSVAREVVAGLVIGFVIAFCIGLAGALWQGDVRIGLVVGGSMWVSISLGVLWGASFPILLHRLGLDPAVSSSVFLTTMTDIVSFLLILGSASLFLGGLL